MLPRLDDPLLLLAASRRCLRLQMDDGVDPVEGAFVDGAGRRVPQHLVRGRPVARPADDAEDAVTPALEV